MAMSRTRKTVLIIIGVVVALGLVVVISAALLLAALRQSAPPFAITACSHSASAVRYLITFRRSTAEIFRWH